MCGMKASTKRALSLLLSAGLLVGALAVYAGLIRGEYARIQELRGILAAKTRIFEEEKRDIDQVKLLIDRSQGSSAKLEESLSQSLPQEEMVSSVLAQINAVTQSNGLALQGFGVSYLPIAPSPIKRSFAKNIGTLRLDLKLAGQYLSAKNFLTDLEKNIRVMDVRELKMESVTKTGTDLLNYSLVVDTYYQAK